MMWERLKESLGRAKAGEIIFDYVLNTASNRLKQLLTLAIEDKPVDILSRDPLLISDLFWKNGNPRRICERLVDYMHETNFKWPELETEAGSVLLENSGGQYDYDIALSFAGEHRPYVEEVANAIKAASPAPVTNSSSPKTTPPARKGLRSLRPLLNMRCR